MTRSLWLTTLVAVLACTASPTAPPPFTVTASVTTSRTAAGTACNVLVRARVQPVGEVVTYTSGAGNDVAVGTLYSGTFTDTLRLTWTLPGLSDVAVYWAWATDSTQETEVLRADC